MNEPLSEDEFAEVLVRGHENGTAGVRFVQDLLVNDAGCQLGDVQHLVAVPAQTLHHGPLDAFIRKQIHADGALMG